MLQEYRLNRLRVFVVELVSVVRIVFDKCSGGLVVFEMSTKPFLRSAARNVLSSADTFTTISCNNCYTWTFFLFFSPSKIQPCTLRASTCTYCTMVAMVSAVHRCTTIGAQVLKTFPYAEYYIRISWELIHYNRFGLIMPASPPHLL